MKAATAKRRETAVVHGRLRQPLTASAAAANVQKDPWAWKAGQRLGSNSPHYPEPITHPVANKKKTFETALVAVANGQGK